MVDHQHLGRLCPSLARSCKNPSVSHAWTSIRRCRGPSKSLYSSYFLLHNLPEGQQGERPSAIGGASLPPCHSVNHRSQYLNYSHVTKFAGRAGGGQPILNSIKKSKKIRGCHPAKPGVSLLLR